MIFVSVGTNEARFDRLVEAVERLGSDEEVVVQHGPSPVRPSGATCVDYFSFEEMTDHLARARVAVLHAGVGSVLAALAAGTRPVVVPRLQRHGEAVDDHQVGFGRRLHEEGLVVLVEELERLPEVVAAHDGGYEGAVGVEGRLVEELRALISTAARR
jgi:UDP-N-acetylglucosamine--N-acetylmuramyl-(pentapeptide) pyrophosphoryl-undecaprenol N-acetylglucosamine transferase